MMLNPQLVKEKSQQTPQLQIQNTTKWVDKKKDGGGGGGGGGGGA